MLVKDGHLGGFVAGGDQRTYSPKLWEEIIRMFSPKSVIDVGCGEGHSCLFFKKKGLKVLAIDGSKKVLDSAVYSPIVIHDYVKGKYSPKENFDLVWCCEFVEHVEEKFVNNFLETFSKADVVVMTHALPKQGGYHHVNEQNPEYWISKMKSIGYEFLHEETISLRAISDGLYFQRSGLVFKRKK